MPGPQRVDLFLIVLTLRPAHCWKLPLHSKALQKRRLRLTLATGVESNDPPIAPWLNFIVRVLPVRLSTPRLVREDDLSRLR